MEGFIKMIYFILLVLMGITIYLIFVVRERNLFLKTLEQNDKKRLEYRVLLLEMIDGYDETLDMDIQVQFLKKYMKKVEKKLEHERKENGRKRRTEIDCY